LPDPNLARFLVLANARTGSYMLVQALNSHSQIVCFSELFQAEFDYVDFNVAGYDNYDPEAKAVRDGDFKRFLDERIFAGHPEGTRAAGFKLLYAHVWGFPGLLEHLIEDTALKIVHLKRRNALRILVSTRLAERTGVWQVHPSVRPADFRRLDLWWRALTRPTRAVAALRRWLRAPQPASEEQPLILSRDECEEFFFRVRHEEQHFERLFQGHPIHDLFYADLVEERDATLDSVQSFLGVEPERLTVTLQRQHPQPLSELVANYDELRREFRGTPNEEYFE
jgi:LPS sulfotransferase NodH